jgi:hypothetical protein
MDCFPLALAFYRHQGRLWGGAFDLDIYSTLTPDFKFESVLTFTVSYRVSAGISARFGGATAGPSINGSCSRKPTEQPDESTAFLSQYWSSLRLRLGHYSSILEIHHDVTIPTSTNRQCAHRST